MRVHVVGNVCIDTTFRLARFPQPGETLNAASHADGIGGKGANQAVAAARTGTAVSLWAAIGDDAGGLWIKDRLAADLDPNDLMVLPLPSDRSTILVDDTGENLIVSGVSCASAFDPWADTLLKRSVAAGDIVVMQGNLRGDVTASCLAAAKAAGATTILNPSPLTPGDTPDLAGVDLVVANEAEASALTGHAVPQAAIQALVRLGAGAAIVTLGERGCLFLGADGIPESIDAELVPVVDTSGAGDVFCGCLAGCLAKGLSVAQAARVAVKAAALSVGRPGTLQSCPSAAEMTSLIKTMETENA